jgi:acyl transferase domain-containing protein/NADPH:quinone reductase-like Zn-dependent oxidoreductase/SAM-dependent methyltransferase/acyl carrier protein
MTAPAPIGAVAIIGMSGRFPGAPDIDTLWRNLSEGTESIARFSDAELLGSGVPPDLLRNPNYVPAAAVLEDVERFDAEFFRFTAREAECADPQQRLLLECAWEALEQAGYADTGFDRVGVYVGTGPSDYWIKNLAPNPELASFANGIQLMMGNATDYAATRISYKLNLTGPSLTVNTACSTSLVAVHLACTSLLDFHCDMALAGGASVSLPVREGYLFQEGGIGSPDGHCRPFDAKAVGTVTGSGVAMVALRRLEDALNAGDSIHAIILGSAANNDGSDKVGFTAPSELGQAAVIAEALSAANISPDTVTYIEAHGTGTPLGDPIEVAALTRVFRRNSARRQFCALGSVKSNFGHLDQAAGVSGLIKTVLALRNRTLPPSLHFEKPNPKLDLENSPFFVNTTARDWVSQGPRRAGVSSFGVGGTNAHVVLEEAPAQLPAPAARSTCLLVLSAKTREALDTLRQNLAKHLERHQELGLADISFTLAAGRRAFPKRHAIVCNNHHEAVAKLRILLPSPVVAPRSTVRVAFLFSAEHSSGDHSCSEFYRTEPAFREAIDACANVLRDRHGFSPSDVFFLSDATSAEAGARLDETLLGLAKLFSRRYAVSVLLRSWGVEPGAIIGDCLGEYVAAVLAGVFSLADALALVASRAHLCDAAEEFARTAVLRPPRIPFVSNVTGDWITPELATDPGYWMNHLHLFAPAAEGMKRLRDVLDVQWLEVGAGHALIPSSEQCSPLTSDIRILPTLAATNSADQSYTTLLSTLGELWTLGVAVDWNNFFKFEQRRRVPLPTYPFERRRYWIDPPPPVRELGSARAPSEIKVSASPVDSWFYAPRWTQAGKPTGLLLSGAAWILVSDKLGLANAVATILRQAGAKVVTIHNGDAYSRPSSDEFVFPLKDPSAHAQMWHDLGRLAQPEVHLLLFDLAKPLPPDSWKMRSESTLVGTLHLLALVQGLGSSAGTSSLAVLTNNTQAVRGDDVDRPETAALWGAMRAVAKEYPNLRCQALDLDWNDLEEGSIQQVAGDLLAGLAYPAPNLALRNKTLWEQRIEPVRLTEAKDLRIRERGTYLITGGLGSMGMAFAEYLARTARARIALVTRTNLSSPHVETSGGNGAVKAGKKTRFPLLTDINSVEAMERAAQRETNVVSLSDYPGLEPLLNRCCSALAWGFVSAGFTSLHSGAYASLKQIQVRLGVLPKFQRLFLLLVQCLAEDGFVEQHESEIEIKALPRPEELVRELADRFPQFIPLVDLISHCTQSYAQALSGEIPAITVLYPDGTPQWLDAAMARVPQYSWNPVYLRVASDLVTHLVRMESDPVRILEIGGGAGDLTSRLLEVIASGKVEYHFTDISQTSLSRARDQAVQRGLRDVQFARFDISQPPEPQGFRPGSYDLVLGYNVIHATPDLVQTTKYLRSLLSEDGGLVLVEMMNAPRWIDLIWGLSDGWWAFTDRQRRQWSPLVPLEEWEKVLAESGFSSSRAYPREPSGRQGVDAGLIVGKASTPASRDRAYSPTSIHKSPEQIARVRQRISQMEADGGEVCVIAADVSDPDEVARAVGAAEKRFGPIQGVIHTAGVLGQTLIHDETQTALQRVLAPKVNGTICLASVLAGRSLDFFILCSSLSSIEPIPGQFAYSAANAFLDSFAQFRATRSCGLTVSIDWGFWQELGMIETARIPETAKQAVLDEIKSAGWSGRGLEIFARILQSNAPAQLLVSPRPVPARSDVQRRSEVVKHPILHECVLESAQRSVFSGTITAGATWLVDEHRVAGQLVLPGTAYLDLAVAAFWHRHRLGPVELTDVCFLAPMVFAERETKLVRLILEQHSSLCEFRVLGQLAPDKWQEHARGGIRRMPPGTSRKKIDLETTEMGLSGAFHAGGQDPTEFWNRVRGFPAHWRNISGAVFGEKKGLARLELPVDLAGDLPNYALHPALLDTATGFLTFRSEWNAFVPFSFRRICVFDTLPARCASLFSFLPTHARNSLAIAGLVVDLAGNEIVRVDQYSLRCTAALTANTHLSGPGASNTPENVQLEIGSPGQLLSLIYRPAPRLHPNPGEVEIEVRAAGLNFVEVLYALGMLPNLSVGRVALGQECAGVVVDVGDGVNAFKRGDEVFAYGSACFSLYTTLSATTVALKPSALSFEAAAGLPAAYVTAWYSLVHLARLRPGERVLIHAAAGGVGLAAVRIAQWLGAEIFATAGSPQKRQFLQEIGVRHVMDSRSFLFADEIHQITNGDGIDVVLNSLSGDFIVKSLGLLRRHGRFLELGKRDIFRNTALGLGTFANYIAFFAVDLGPDIPGFAEIWQELIANLQSGNLAELPHQTFAAARVRDAFEYMAQARHIGKIVLSFADAQTLREAANAQPAGLDWKDVVRPDQEVAHSAPEQNSPAYQAFSAATAQPAKHERPRLQTEFRSPESSTEKTIASAWEELLGVAPIGAEDDFFELNGDSLLAAQVMSRLHQLLEIKMPLSLIFDFPTVRGLASQIADRLPPPSATVQDPNLTAYEEGTI